MENSIFRPLDSLILGGSVWQNNKSSLLSAAFAQQRPLCIQSLLFSENACARDRSARIIYYPSPG